MMDQFTILKFVGIDPELIGPLEAYVKSTESHIPELLKCEIHTDGKSEEFYATDSGTECLRIISSERDKTHETYTVKVILITAFQVEKYVSAQGEKITLDKGEHVIIKPPREVLLGLMRVLQMFPAEQTIEKVKRF